MGDRKMLRTGDPCPCCGQPILTKDPELLELLTFIRDSRCNTAAGTDYLLRNRSTEKEEP